MKNKFFILVVSVMILMSCASTDRDETEPAEVILYRMAQDRMTPTAPVSYTHLTLPTTPYV